MKILTIIFLFSSLALFSENNVRVNFNLYNSSTPKNIFYFGFGIDELAGDSVDTHLGEKSYPPFAPTFDAGLEYIDSSQYNSDGTKYYDLIRTNLDLRAIKKDINKWQIRHKLVINWIGAPTVVLEWNNLNIPDIVDSIMIRDIMGGIVINKDMKKINKLVLDNDAIDKLYFDIYYDLTKTSIEENENKDNLFYPNPFSYNVNLKKDFVYDNYEVFDLNGNKIIIDKDINKLTELNKGIYYIIFKLNNLIIEKSIISKY